MIECTALAPGSAITISGTTYALPAIGSGILIDGALQALPQAPAGPVPTVEVARLIATPPHLGILVIEGWTLLAGSEVPVSGTTYSLPKSSSELFVNEQPTALPSTHPYEVFTIGSIAMTPTFLPDSKITHSSRAPAYSSREQHIHSLPLVPNSS